MLSADGNTKTDAEDLSWEDIFSNDEVAYQALSSKLPEEVLSSLPTFGGRYAYVNYDTGGIIFVNTYDKEENTELLSSYGAKLLAAGYTHEVVETTDGPVNTYSINFTSGKRQYGLTLSLYTFWNSNQEWGQFQVHIAIGAAKK